MELPPVGQAVEVLFDAPNGQFWTQGEVVQIGPIEDTGEMACWVQMQFSGYGATLPYTLDDFLVGMIRVVRVTRQRQRG